MTCTPPIIGNADYCEGLQHAVSGISHVIKVIPIASVATAPVYGPAGPVVGYTSDELRLLALGDLVLGNGITPITLPCIVEKNPMHVTGGKGFWHYELEIQLQNTLQNRSVVAAMRGYAFILAVTDLATGDTLIVGRHTNVHHACRIDPASLDGQWGGGFNDEKFQALKFYCHTPVSVYPVYKLSGAVLSPTYIEYTTTDAISGFAPGSTPGINKLFGSVGGGNVTKVQLKLTGQSTFTDLTYTVISGNNTGAFYAAQAGYQCFFSDFGTAGKYRLYFTPTSGFSTAPTGLPSPDNLAVVTDNTSKVRIHGSGFVDNLTL